MESNLYLPVEPLDVSKDAEHGKDMEVDVTSRVTMRAKVTFGALFIGGVCIYAALASKTPSHMMEIAAQDPVGLNIPGYCPIMKTSCSLVFSEAADNEADCQLDTAEADGACEAAGAGPEDPLADTCAAAFTTTIEIACTSAVKAGDKFGSAQCDDAVGCGCKASSTADGGACTGGQDTCCQGGAACGRYDNSGHNFQCCNNYGVVNGVAWCQNGAGGQCSDGNDDNCADNQVCGRYNNQKKDYQCCSSYQVVDGVAWCANALGAPCSNGEDSNCLSPMACGVWASSSSGYACCSDITTPGGIATCTNV